MKLFTKKRNCCGCHACYNVCPKQAIDMIDDEEGFLYPRINDEKCINCGLCKKVCPIINLKLNKKPLAVYAGRSECLIEQTTSSSGGLFPVLARYILKKNGVICGASFADDHSVEHTVISNKSSLQKLQGSKYVQSRIGNVFATLELKLKYGVPVLFCGTPCQVAGFKSYLRKEYENLLCIDLICHGVPSPQVWLDYISTIATEKQISTIQFRKKNQQNGHEYFVLNFSDGTFFEEEKNLNLFMNGFIQNVYLRPSCFFCHFKNNAHNSDITLGDFWSVTEFHPNFCNGLGTSAIIIRSTKGNKVLAEIKDNLFLETAKIQEIAVWNDNLLKSSLYTPKRDIFFSQWRHVPLLILLSNIISLPESKTSLYSPILCVKKLKQIIRNVLKR